MAPSTSSSTFCCCSKYFRRQENAPPAAPQLQLPQIVEPPIEVQHQQLQHLSVPPRFVAQAPQVAQHPKQDDETFETARTSRQTDDARIISMSELFRKVRIEEGLEVTPRPQQQQPKMLPSRMARRAVFNNDGDITTRTAAGEIRKLSVSSLGTSIQIPTNHHTNTNTSIIPLGITRKMSAAPQIITAFFAVTYACLTGLLTAITNIFVRV